MIYDFLCPALWQTLRWVQGVRAALGWILRNYFVPQVLCFFLNVLMINITNSATFFSRFWLDPVYVDLWNVAHLVNKKDKMKLLHHTRNGLERYNKCFNSIWPTSHPNLASFAHPLKKRQIELFSEWKMLPRDRRPLQTTMSLCSPVSLLIAMVKERRERNDSFYGVCMLLCRVSLVMSVCLICRAK